MNFLLSVLPLLAMFFAHGHSQARNGQFEVPMTAALKKEILDFHNKVRSGLNAGIPNLVWNTSLEASAKAWGKRCIFDHGPKDLLKSIGQNLAFNTDPVDKTATNSMQAWLDERKDYRGTKIGEGGPMSFLHYTAMIWKKTTQIGCSLYECKPLYGSERGDIFTDWGYGKLYHIVCNYWPKSNMYGEHPYY